MLSDLIRERGTTTCDDVAELLAGVVDGSARLEGTDRRHVEQCLRCQAEVVQYRKLLRALQAMRAEVIEPAPGLLPELLNAVGEAAEHRAMRGALSGRKAAYLGGIAAATAAAAGGAIVIASRSRKRFKLAS